VQGICNYNCIICGINKPTYSGPKAYQSQEVTKKLTERIKEAIAEGIKIKYVANSGDGEPTLHPEFGKRMNLFGEMIKELQKKHLPLPDVYVVTNGSNLRKPGILEAISDNHLGLNISFPTSHPEHYGEIMMMKPADGKRLLKKVVPCIEKAMQFLKNGKLPYLNFHISPPYREYVRSDFPETLEFLANLAKKNKIREIQLVIFPSTSNRTSLIKHFSKRMDFFKDYFRKYNNKTVFGVKIKMMLTNKKFYPKRKDLIDILSNFKFPCLVYGNPFITVFGDSCCCNDQNLASIEGNILTMSINQLMNIKENYLPSDVCKRCDQSPERLSGSIDFICYSSFSFIKKLFFWSVF